MKILKERTGKTGFQKQDDPISEVPFRHHACVRPMCALRYL